MENADGKQNEDVLRYTAQIVSSYMQNNELPVSDIPNLFDIVHGKLADLKANGGQVNGNHQPAVPIEQSITPDHIICLEDGKKFKMLKKHLRAQYDMSPEDYRLKWGLPTDYPMVAPNYATKRQELARASGLGKHRKNGH